MEVFALEIVFLLVAAFATGCVVGHVARGLLDRNESYRSSPDDGHRDHTARRSKTGRKIAKNWRKKPSQDNLTRIKGIGPTIEKSLNRLGIKRFEQIANWDMVDLAVIDQRLAFKGRIEREGWVSQAHKLVSRKS